MCPLPTMLQKSAPPPLPDACREQMAEQRVLMLQSETPRSGLNRRLIVGAGDLLPPPPATGPDLCSGQEIWSTLLVVHFLLLSAH